MAKEYTITKEEGIKRICEAIREAYAISDAIDDEHLATNSTFSSVKIDSLLSDIDTRVDKLENGSGSGGSGGSITIDNALSDTSENPVQNKVVNAALNEKASKDTMTGATSSANGTSGLVPAPAVDDIDKFLRGDGTWGTLDSSIISQNIDGIPVDLTGIYNTQMIGYDEEQGKLVPMNAVARTQTVLPSNETPKIWEITDQANVTKPDLDYNYIIVQVNSGITSSNKAMLKGYFKNPFMLSEFTSITISGQARHGVTLKLSKNADFSSIDAEYSFNVLYGSPESLCDITHLQGKYYVQFELYCEEWSGGSGSSLYINKFIIS